MHPRGKLEDDMEDKLKELNVTLKDVENNLMSRKIERQDATIDDALEIINMAQEAGAIEVDDCAACGD